MDVNFVNNGNIIVLTFSTSGSIFYNLADYNPIMRCITPQGERKPPQWVSCCSSEHTSSTTELSLHLLASSNGFVYVFEMMSKSEKDNKHRPSTSSLEDSVDFIEMRHDSSATNAILLCPLLCVIELPPDVSG